MTKRARFALGFIATGLAVGATAPLADSRPITERPAFAKYERTYSAVPPAKRKGLGSPKRIARSGSVPWLVRSSRILFWRTHPTAWRVERANRLHPRDAAAIIWGEEYGWSSAEIESGRYVIDHENGRWNPCGVYDDGGASCERGRALVAAWGGNRACTIGMFKPCRLHLMRPDGAVDQLRAIADYMEHRYGGAHGAASFKRRVGWY